MSLCFYSSLTAYEICRSDIMLCINMLVDAYHVLVNEEIEIEAWCWFRSDFFMACPISMTWNLMLHLLFFSFVCGSNTIQNINCFTVTSNEHHEKVTILLNGFEWLFFSRLSPLSISLCLQIELCFFNSLFGFVKSVLPLWVWITTNRFFWVLENLSSRFDCPNNRHHIKPINSVREFNNNCICVTFSYDLA